MENSNGTAKPPDFEYPHIPPARKEAPNSSLTGTLGRRWVSALLVCSHTPGHQGAYAAPGNSSCEPRVEVLWADKQTAHQTLPAMLSRC